MEGGRGSVGPATNSNSHSHSHSRPVRSSSRYFYGHSSSTPATFSGPVRRWEKKWVHVSSSQSSTTPSKPRKLFLSNGSTSPDSPILLCKWTPLCRSPSSVDGNGDSNSVELCRRKFRYTPITVFEEKKKLTAKDVADEDKSEETDKSSAERPIIDGDDIYGLLDINNDFMGSRQDTSEGDLIYTRRSHLNLGMQMEKNKDHQPDLNMLWATN